MVVGDNPSGLLGYGPVVSADLASAINVSIRVSRAGCLIIDGHDGCTDGFPVDKVR